MTITAGDKRLAEKIYKAVFGETPEQRAERLKTSIEEEKAKRSIIRYYLKNQFEGLSDFCDFLEVDYLFAEKAIAYYLEEQKKA